MTDISNIVAKPRAIDILHPASGEPIGLSVSILPDTHEQVRAVDRKHLDARLAGKGKIDAESLESNILERLTASIESWSWAKDATFEGKQPSFSPAEFKRVVTKLPWMRAQIEAELSKTTEFFRPADEGVS